MTGPALELHGIDAHGRLTGVARPGVMVEVLCDGRPVASCRAALATGRFGVALDPVVDLIPCSLSVRLIGETWADAAGWVERDADGYRWHPRVADARRYDARVEQVVGTTIVGAVRDRMQETRAPVVDVFIDGRYHRSVQAGLRSTNPATGGDHHFGFVVTLTAGRGAPEVTCRIATEPDPFFRQVIPLGPAGEQDETTRAADRYARWLDHYGLSRAMALARGRIAAGGRPPRGAVVVSAGAVVDGDAWRRTVASIAGQLVPAERVVLVDPPGGVDTGILSVVLTDDRWASVVAATEDADTLLMVAAGDVLEPVALLTLTDALDAESDAPFVYADEDRPIGRTDPRRLPVFKTAWDIELARVQDVFAFPALVRRSAIVPPVEGRVSCAAWRVLLHGAADSGAPRHLPLVLLHRQATHDALAVASPLPDIAPAPVPADWPLVSAIVPTRDMLDLLAPCVEGLLFETDYPALEVVVADNDSSDPATLAFLARMADDPRVRVIRHPGAFDYAAINNNAVAAARGTVVALLNNDIAIRHSDWLKRMVREAIRPDVGAVGARLLYGDGRLQHGGVVIGIGGVASHLGKRMPGDGADPNGRLRHLHQVSAVTAACLVVRRTLWDAVGGLSPDFPVAFNDVDFCLRLQALGYRNLVQPDACLFHLESASRGREDTPAKKARFAADKAQMQAAWPGVIESDPFVSPNWARDQARALPAFPPRYRAFFDQSDAISRR